MVNTSEVILVQLFPHWLNEVTDGVKNQVQYDAILDLILEDMVAWRGTNDDRIENPVCWLGFETNEDTWEPVIKLFEDVPDLLLRYLRTIQETNIHLSTTHATRLQTETTGPPAPAPSYALQYDRDITLTLSL